MVDVVSKQFYADRSMSNAMRELCRKRGIRQDVWIRTLIARELMYQSAPFSTYLKPGDTFKNEGDTFWQSGIDIGDHMQAIIVYRATEKEAKDWRSDIMVGLDQLNEPAIWPEWAVKIKEMLEEFGHEFEPGEDIDLPESLREWLAGIEEAK